MSEIEDEVLVKMPHQASHTGLHTPILHEALNQFSAFKKIILDAPDGNHRLIAQLKKDIADKRYQMDSAMIARRMLAGS